MSLLFSNVIKTCPMCRAQSRYITPSSQFFAEGDPRKQKILEDYKASMARVPCRYFERSSPLRRFCPYGSDCFYKHENPNGSTHRFDHGVDRMMMVFKEDIQTRRGPARYRMLRPAYTDVAEDGLSDGSDPLDAFRGHEEVWHFTSDNEMAGPTPPQELAFGVVPPGWDGPDLADLIDSLSLDTVYPFGWD